MCFFFFLPTHPHPRPKQEPVKCTRHKGSPEQLSAPQQACSLLSAYLGQDTAAVTTGFSLPVRVCVTCTDSALVKWCAASDAAENVWKKGSSRGGLINYDEWRVARHVLLAEGGRRAGGSNRVLVAGGEWWMARGGWEEKSWQARYIGNARGVAKKAPKRKRCKTKREDGVLWKCLRWKIENSLWTSEKADVWLKGLTFKQGCPNTSFSHLIRSHFQAQISAKTTTIWYQHITNNAFNTFFVVESLRRLHQVIYCSKIK